MNISDIDKNFVSQTIGGVDLKFINAKSEPLEICGFPWFRQKHNYCRIPEGITDEVSEGVRVLGAHTSGGAIRFRANSTTIGLRVELNGLIDMLHMPRTGSSGFDLFSGCGTASAFVNNIRPGVGETAYSGIFSDNLSGDMQDYTIYFPLYNGVKDVQIAILPEAETTAASPFTIEQPILFYGSSITQGGCASRPGNSYTHIVTRRLNANLINWGFSGGAKGEAIMAETIAGLDLSAMVLDYDCNAPDPEHLEKTHEPFFRIIREHNSNLPIIIISRPHFYGTASDWQRRDIIRRTYENAIKNGDRHCYFIDGETLFGNSERDLCTVDRSHPNDIGFLRMANVVTPVLKDAFGRVS